MIEIYVGIDAVGQGFVTCRRDGKRSSSTSGIRNLMSIDQIVADYVNWYGKNNVSIMYLAQRESRLIGAF